MPKWLVDAGRTLRRIGALLYRSGFSAPGGVLLRASTVAHAHVLLKHCPPSFLASEPALVLSLCALMAGFLTRPLALGWLVAAVLAGMAADGSIIDTPLLSGLTALTLLLFGAGPWSVDAYCFGRRVITIRK